MTHPKDSVEFQELCSRAAMRAAERCREEGVDAQLAGPCMVSIVFRLQRPKGHYGTGRNAGILKASSPHVPVTKPDVDKMVRVVLDALTGIAFMDDSQVVELRALKKYADDNPHPPGATCQVYELQFEEEG
jgi:Holliday junction resolvase RusA-like endonuclease